MSGCILEAEVWEAALEKWLALGVGELVSEDLEQVWRWDVPRS
jgi:hypothetical protein